MNKTEKYRVIALDVKTDIPPYESNNKIRK